MARKFTPVKTNVVNRRLTEVADVGSFLSKFSARIAAEQRARKKLKRKIKGASDLTLGEKKQSSLLSKLKKAQTKKERKKISRKFKKAKKKIRQERSGFAELQRRGQALQGRQQTILTDRAPAPQELAAVG